MVERGDIWLVALDAAAGTELREARPCLVVSPDEMHDHLRTVIVAPMTTGGHAAPFRVPLRHARKRGLVLLDQLRTVDKVRLVRRLGAASSTTLRETLSVLREVFAD
jgi:mRNA interferase MazF